MSTRGGAAAKALGAKKTLVRLLFGGQNLLTAQGRQAVAGKLDPSTYSYGELRSAYLDKIKDLHPDTNQSKSTNHQHLRMEFQSLQDAWSDYNSLATKMKRVDGGHEESDFTMFGVGCSFSDSEQEREWRIEIMDQASRGWFSAGALPSKSESTFVRQRHHSLLTMDEFEEHKKKMPNWSSFSKEEKSDDQNHEFVESQPGTRKDLVSHMLPPSRRKS